ncbi:hypothetical protein CBI38_30500 [Rhodococcus oxybenzonivorans]|uniref:Uncharacterized protein n=1 Tax=Rhodococcus oxybenzonivorans TaxID=1990687 RepID=A0A2S2C2Z5_9NOCA|nr:hypothetical protein CBI38_30500 [Rhodococcus oxybenzonivorans]
MFRQFFVLARPGSPEPEESRTIDRLPRGAHANTETSLLRRSGHTPSRASIETSITITGS